MTWTIERPTKPGWYWFRGMKYVPTLVYIQDDMRIVFLGLKRKPRIVEMDAYEPEWAGPLEPPP